MVTIVYTFAGGKLVWEIQLSLGSHDSFGAAPSIKAGLGAILTHFTSRFRTVHNVRSYQFFQVLRRRTRLSEFHQFSVVKDR